MENSAIKHRQRPLLVLIMKLLVPKCTLFFSVLVKIHQTKTLQSYRLRKLQRFSTAADPHAYNVLGIRRAQAADDGHEDVDGVEVQGDGRHDVLVVGVPLDQVVGVVDDEAGEHQRDDAPVHRRRHTPHRQQHLQGSRASFNSGSERRPWQALSNLEVQRNARNRDGGLVAQPGRASRA